MGHKMWKPEGRYHEMRLICEILMGDGAEGQNRTVDTSLFRAVLCQLSYLGIPAGFFASAYLKLG